MNNTMQEDGEIITDSCLLIGKKMYHIECQSTDDTTMVIRMIGYDFAIGIEHAEKQGRRYRIEFPKSCVLFLRSSGNTSDYLEEELTETGKSELYTDLTKLIVKIADYIFSKEEDVRKGIGEIMGGKVLELESERLKAEGKAIGRAEGEAIGQARGEAIGQVQGEARLGSLITRLIQDERTEEIPIVSTDSKRREQLYREYNL